MSGETNQKKGSPRVTHISWGRMDVAGFGRGRDFSSTPAEGASAHASGRIYVFWHCSSSLVASSVSFEAKRRSRCATAG